MWPACSKNWAGSNMPDLTSRHGSYCAKLTWIQSGWPDQGLAKHIWSGSKLVCRSHWAQGATGPLPVSHFQTWLHFSTDVLDHVVQNQPRSDLVLGDCQVWAKRIGPEANWCFKNSFQWFQTDPDWMWTEFSMFTGVCQCPFKILFLVSFLKQASDNEGSTCISPAWKVECLNLSHICSMDMIYLESCSADTIRSQPCENFSRLFPDFPVRDPDHGHVRIFPGCSLTFQCRSLVSME